MNMVTRVLIDSTDWSGLRTDSGSADGIPRALEDLSAASAEEAIQSAYWRIDNEVIVQGQLYEAAAPTLEVLLSMAASCSPGPVRRAVAELIQQIVFGQPHSSEIASGNSDIARECKRLASGAIWIFYGWLTEDDSDVRELALLILRKADPDARRKALIFAVCRDVDNSPGVQAVFSEIDRGMY